MEGTRGTSARLPTASIVKGAARELGKGFETQRREIGTAQDRAGEVPKLAADPRAAVRWKDVNNIDLDAAWDGLVTRRTAADEPHHLVRDRGHQVDALCNLQ